MPWPKGKPFPQEAKEKRVATFKANGKKAKKPILIDGFVHWQCPKCLRILLPVDFYRAKKAVNGLTSQCRQCHCKTTFLTRDKEKSREANKTYMRHAREKNPEIFRKRDRERSAFRRDEHARARSLLRSAVRAGKIQRPDSCSRCGKQEQITGHHPDYSKPLEVIWLCYECHGREHRID